MTSFVKGVRACSRPKMSNHRGRTWDQADVILPDGTTITCYFDTTWGERFYFPYAGRWYNASVNYQMPGSWNFDLRPESWELPIFPMDPPKYIANRDRAL